MLANNFCVGNALNFLQNLTDKERDIFQENSSLLRVSKGEVVFYEEEELHKLFCICEGACKFSLIDDFGKEHITKLLGKGDVMGRRAVITNKGALVTATALSDTIIYSLDKQAFKSAINNNSKLCKDVLNGFIGDLDKDVEKIKYFKNHSSVKSRLAGLICYLYKIYGEDDNGWISVSLKRIDMASMLSTTSEYVISLLSSFKQNNILEINRDKIKILSHNKLNIIREGK